MSDSPKQNFDRLAGMRAGMTAHGAVEPVPGRGPDGGRAGAGDGHRRLNKKLPPSGMVFRAVTGTICLVPVLQGTNRLYGQFSRFRVHELGIVTSVADSGAVGGYKCYGARLPGLWHEVESVLTDPAQGFLGCYVVPPDRLTIEAEQVLRQVPQRFPSVDDARLVLKPYLGNALCPQSVI